MRDRRKTVLRTPRLSGDREICNIAKRQNLLLTLHNTTLKDPMIYLDPDNDIFRMHHILAYVLANEIHIKKNKYNPGSAETEYKKMINRFARNFEDKVNQRVFCMPNDEKN